MVSGTISLPSRGTFHHSLTVLSTIGYQEVFRLSEWSRQIHSTLHGNAATREHHHTRHVHFRLRDSHPLRPGIPTCSTNTHNHAEEPAAPSNDAPQHRTRNPCQVSHAPGLAYSAFARHYSRNHQCFLFLRVLRCFTSPRSPATLYIQEAVTRHHSGWVSPFGHPRITARLTAPRGISQPPTSFIGPWYQGIHHVPYITWPQRCSHPLYSSQTTTEKTHTCVLSDTQQRTDDRKQNGISTNPMSTQSTRTCASSTLNTPQPGHPDCGSELAP